MKDWWLNLPLRDKRMLLMGGIIVILFLLYEIIWSPLATTNENLRVHIQHNRSTLQFMQNADQRIQQLVKESKEKNNKTSGSVLGIMQTEINNSQFAAHVTELRQAENDAVQFNLRKVNFDQLLVFLMSVWKKYHYVVSQISVVPTGVPGEVTVDITIKSS